MKLPKVSLTWKILIGLVLGILIGWAIHASDITSQDHHVLGIETATILAFIKSLSTLFLNLIKTIIAPLIFATLVVGIAGTGDIKQVGRMGAKSLLYFEVVTTLALVIGLAAVNIVQPGKGVSLAGVTRTDDKATLAKKAQDASKQASDAAKHAEELRSQIPTDPNAALEYRIQLDIASQKAADAAAAASQGLTAAEPPAKPKTFADIVSHLSPTSIIQAMAEGDVLGIVIFSVIFALACTAIGEKAKPVLNWCQSLADIMFRFTEYVMKFAPVGVGAAMAYTVASSDQGLGVMKNLGALILTLYGALIVFALLVLLPIALLFKVPLRDFFDAVKTPATIAFATTSSESALPRAMENLARLGVPRRIVGFVLPTGYSFNLDGTTLYLSLASIFVAQAAGSELADFSSHWAQQLVMVATLMLTSKGAAGVPRASLVILIGALASFSLPVEGVILILGIDSIMDMARTMTNVIGNCLATVVIAKWENAFRNDEWEAEERELEEVTGETALA